MIIRPNKKAVCDSYAYRLYLCLFFIEHTDHRTAQITWRKHLLKLPALRSILIYNILSLLQILFPGPWRVFL